MELKEQLELADKCAESLVQYMEQQFGYTELSCCAMVGLATSDGKLIHSNNTACHAGLHRYDEGKPDFELVVSLNQVDYGQFLEDEYAVPYIDWLVNRSPYAPAFITKDAESCMEKGYVATTTDVPSNQMVGGFIAQRRLWEYSDMARAWYEFVKAGMNENLAYCMAHSIQSTSVNGSIQGGSLAWGKCRRGHTSLDIGDMGPKAVKRFVLGEMNIKDPTYRKKNRYGNIDITWGTPRRGEMSLYHAVQGVRLVAEDKVESCNPFPLPEKYDAMTGSYPRVVESLVLFGNKYLEEIGVGHE